MNPLISIIVPNYNHAAFLEERLESIFNQTFQDFEVILLDDASTDNSLEILSKYAAHPKVSDFIINKENSGSTFKQWDKGVNLAKGDFIWIAETDDFCELNFLEELLPPLQKDKEVVLSYCQSNKVNEDGIVIGNWLEHTNNLDADLFLKSFIWDGNEFIERFLIYKNVIPNASAVLFRKDRAVKLWYLDMDPLLKTCGDWLCYLRLLANKKVSYQAKLLNNFRNHSNSVIANATKREKFLGLKNIEIKARGTIMNCLSNLEPSNLKAIAKNNSKITKKLKYEKALYFIRNNEKIKGYFLLTNVLDVFLEKYNFENKLKSFLQVKPKEKKIKPIEKFRLYLNYFNAKNGIEIGGPSVIFSNELPIYPIMNSLDGCNFSTQTIWEGNIVEGENFNYFENRKGYQYICEANDLTEIPNENYDFIIASHCLEHCANTLKTVKEWLRVIKKGGAILLILPDKRYTFDHKRPLTTFEHLEDDLESGIKETDLKHLTEILELHDLSMDLPAGTIEEFKKRSLDNFKNRCLHHHIFDFTLLQRIFAHFDVKIIDMTFVPPYHQIILGVKQ